MPRTLVWHVPLHEEPDEAFIGGRCLCSAHTRDKISPGPPQGGESQGQRPHSVTRCQTTMPGVLLNKRRRGSSAENCVPRLPRVQVESLDSPSSSLHFSLICPTTDQLPGKLGHPFIFCMISFQHFYWTVLQVCKWKSTGPVVFLRVLC